MRRSIPLRVAALSLMTVCGVGAIVWSRSQVHAAVPPAATVAAAVTQFAGGAGGAEELAIEDAPKVYVRVPYTPEAAATYKLLQTKLDMPFGAETPLSDMIKYIITSLDPRDDKGKRTSDGPPLQFYLNGRVLEEVEKTQDSPITLDLVQIPVSTSLELALDQLNMAYYVRPDGIIAIAVKDSDEAASQEPMLLVLDQVRRLRSEVADLRRELRGHAPDAPAPANAQTAGTGMMGGMGGGFR